ncbi:carbonic anhydrase 3-like isoform X2 [Maniola jurtina]|uniref:carbonic anhydrase 3-like isoform X2 n=1 Tax=Maniola jurtina TaxID=191418 RepID=UPI001E68EADB|nr:carbonic anhydrase 3-like isoform X2 [Maniola jurtina]
MVFHKEIVFYALLLIIIIHGYKENTKDQTSTRANTLFDDADDIQRQLDNEAHDKNMMFGNGKQIQTTTPKKLGIINKYELLKQVKHWSYKDQSNWHKQYPECGGHSQSPVDLPAVGLIHTKGGRQLTFLNYDVVPKRLTLKTNAKRLVLYGEWEYELQPVVYGGASHSRRYLFHSITLRWPSEHRIGGLQYPLESQVIHISAEYKTFDNAINATLRDAQAILGIVNLYKYSNETQQGLDALIRVARHSRNIDAGLPPIPLMCFSPPLKEYVAYQGSLTMPPCSENVLWLIRARALPVTREMVDIVFNLIGEGEYRGSFIRQPQPLNDRKVYFFN